MPPFIAIQNLKKSQRRKLVKKYRGRLIRAAGRRADPPIHHSLISRVMNGKATSRRAAEALGAVLAEFPDIHETLAAMGVTLEEA